MEKYELEALERYKAKLKDWREEITLVKGEPQERRVQRVEALYYKRPVAVGSLEGVALSPELAAAMHHASVMDLYDHEIAKQRARVQEKLSECPEVSEVHVGARLETLLSRVSCAEHDASKLIADTLVAELRKSGWKVHVKLEEVVHRRLFGSPFRTLVFGEPCRVVEPYAVAQYSKANPWTPPVLIAVLICATTLLLAFCK